LVRDQTRLASGSISWEDYKRELENCDERIRLVIKQYWAEFLNKQPTEADLIWYLQEFKASPARLNFSAARRQILVKGAFIDEFTNLLGRQPTVAEDLQAMNAIYSKSLETAEEVKALIRATFGPNENSSAGTPTAAGSDSIKSDAADTKSANNSNEDCK
jgi:hypothetical protein